MLATLLSVSPLAVVYSFGLMPFLKSKQKAPSSVPYHTWSLLSTNTQCEKLFLFRQLMPLKVETQLFRLLSRHASPTEVATYTRLPSFDKAILMR